MITKQLEYYNEAKIKADNLKYSIAIWIYQHTNPYVWKQYVHVLLDIRAMRYRRPCIQLSILNLVHTTYIYA